MVRDGRIVAVDRFALLRRDATRVVDIENAIITPALINCHAHLELSCLTTLTEGETENPIQCDRGARNFTDWIRALLAKRANENLTLDSIIEAGRKSLVDQYQRGIVLVADIGNQPSSREIGAGKSPECFFFRELLSITERTAQLLLAAIPIDEQCTAHSPYSCHPTLIRALKERTRRTGTLFPIHLAESAEEVAFLRTGTGSFHDFLLERLRLSGSLEAEQSLADLLPHPGCGGVEYLQTLGVLDDKTICVHAVHVSENEIELLAKAKAKVCLCPASNRKLGVGRAPLPKFLEHQILPGLGTDSLASNDCLDLWHEMKVLQEDHPNVNPEQIFTMSTLGGAATLGVNNRLGSLAPGREARLLVVEFSGQKSDVFPFLVNNGRSQQVSWLEDR